jgi:peptide deformylase
VHLKVIVIDISPGKDNLLVLINPEIVASTGESTLEEGCLSVPGIYDKVARAESIKLRALDADGEGFELDADGLLAVCIQHEMDHLEGKMFVEYLSRLKQNRIRAKMLKQERQSA